MKKWEYRKGCEADFVGGHNEATHKYLHKECGHPVWTAKPEIIKKELFDLVALRELATDEDDLNECTSAPEADVKRGGFIPNATFVGDLLPEGYPTFGHTNCRCKSAKVGEIHIDGKQREAKLANKYLHEIKPGIFVDVYDVLMAWNVSNPALQHLIKKALQPGERGHKSREQDLQDIIDSAIRAKELESK